MGLVQFDKQPENQQKKTVNGRGLEVILSVACQLVPT